MSPFPREQRPSAGTGRRGSECAAVRTSSPPGSAGEGGEETVCPGREGQADGTRTGRLLAPSHRGTRGRAGLVQTQRFTQPASKIHFFHLGPFDEAMVLKGKKRCCEQPVSAGRGKGPGFCSDLVGPPRLKPQNQKRKVRQRRGTHSGQGEKANPEQGGAMPEATQM